MFTATKDDNLSTNSTTTKNSAQNFRDKAEDVKTDLRVVAGEAGHKVRHFIDDATNQITHASDRVTTEIRSNPVQSSMIALGVGFVLGALFRR